MVVGCQPYAPAAFTPGNAPDTHFCWRLSRPQGHSAIGRIMSMKNPMTPAGIEPATFRFVAKHLNHCATANRNVYQGYFLGGKCGRCVGLTNLSPSCADCLEIWKPRPPGTLRACVGQYRNCCTFIYYSSS